VIDAFILKVLIEQELGYPTELVPDGQLSKISSNLTGLASVYWALGSGAVHMYPEVARSRPSAFARAQRPIWHRMCRSGVRKRPSGMTDMCGMLSP
jgi:hypothetical protein